MNVKARQLSLHRRVRFDPTVSSQIGNQQTHHNAKVKLVSFVSVGLILMHLSNNRAGQSA